MWSLLLLCLPGASPYADHGATRPWVLKNPVTVPTRGFVWPAPSAVSFTNTYYIFDVPNFEFKVVGRTCTILDNAMKRYKTIIENMTGLLPNKRTLDDFYDPRLGHLDGEDRKNRSVRFFRRHRERHGQYLENDNLFTTLHVNLTAACQTVPSHVMNEAYQLTLLTNTSILTSSSIWGVLRGLETFSQLPYYADDYTEIRINMTKIKDSPRYPYRGLMLDTSRHYISKENIFKTLDAMAYNKLNVFHWHIVDDQSFPFVSSRFPNMSQFGAYHPKRAVYTPEDVADIIRYARDRAIRVIPEFDTPGHVSSWGKSFPHLLTKCYNVTSGLLLGLGPLNPINSLVYDMLYELFQEINGAFVDSYIHLGGDEVSLSCWISNPDIKRYMEQKNIDVFSLLSLFLKTLSPHLPIRYTRIVWQDVMETSETGLSKKTIIQVWKEKAEPLVEEYVRKGYRVLYSSCWYLDHLDKSWKDFYRCDPRDYTPVNKRNVLGGTACMWGEMMDDTNLMSRVWPRASATAEVLWSKRKAVLLQPPHHLEGRLEEHTCRMRRRGIEASPPTGPGYCYL